MKKEPQEQSEALRDSDKEASTRKKWAHLTKAQIMEVIELVRAGEMSIAAIARRYQASHKTISNIAAKNGVVFGETRQKVADQIRAELETRAASRAVELAERVEATKEKHFIFADQLTRYQMHIISEAVKEKRAMGTITGDLKAIQFAAQNLKILREEKYAVLGMNEEESGDGELPSLVIKELSQEDIKAMGDRGMDEDDISVPELEGDAIGFDEDLDEAVE